MRTFCSISSAALVLLVASAASASSPVLSTILPAGVQRGTEVELTLAGDRLADAQELLWYQPGIETLSVEPAEDGKSVKAAIRIAEDARLGLYDLRIRSATGVSHLRTFSVGAYPEIAEAADANSNFDEPQPIPLNVTVIGVAENEDDDFYVIEAKKGDRITAEVEGIRLGKTLFDPYVAILNPQRFELVRSDDASLVRQDPLVQLIAPEDGKYIIQVRESAYQGNGNCHYRLHVGHFPRPRALVPAGGPIGETVEVQWIGDIEGDRTQAVTLPDHADPNFSLLAEDDRGVSPAPYAFRLSPFGNVIESGSTSEPTSFAPPMGLNGVIRDDGETDQFSFVAKNGQVLDIRVFARSLGSPLDSVLVVSKKAGGNVGANDDSGGPDSYYRFTAPEDGEYLISIRDHLQKGSPDHFYRIEVTPVEPKLTISPQNENPQIGVVTASVPRGNRLAMLVNASRADFGGDLAFSAEGLPEGIALDADTMAAGIAQMPVLLSASADAPVAGTLATLTGAPTDASLSVPSTLAHTVELVQGRNNIPFWTRSVDRLAVSVSEEAPFSIEVVEPKVPLVRNGVMQLKVVATRVEGFTAPIAVSLPWNPPGIGSAGGVSIPEGQNEALIPLNAADNAGLATWKIVVDGSSTGPSGPVTVSSQLVPLTIAEKFLTFEFERAAAEQGSEAPLLVKINQLTPFEGEATVTLVGLPNAATVEPTTITKDAEEIIFPIKIAPETPEGTHKNLFCQVVITQNGEPIHHNLGSTELRVDKPLPKEQPKAEAAAPVPPKPEAKKPLSRLEQLRLEEQQRTESTSGAGEPEN
ncbi:PPC domain-containing protein [Tautonia rosea]|uniref:PPC domain-containing protein n=1 Tax=Tautonia rosea TaxID=2728037 RepID=UPI001473AF1E|nr:PPC domain-containing protein [Tautonia rosea]